MGSCVASLSGCILRQPLGIHDRYFAADGLNGIDQFGARGAAAERSARANSAATT